MPATTAPECPEHGAMLCFGQHGDVRLYRCELGRCDANGSFISRTHREVWVMNDGRVLEVPPNSIMREHRGRLEQMPVKVAQ